MQYMVGLVPAVLGKNAEKVKMLVEKKLSTTNISLPNVANEIFTYLFLLLGKPSPEKNGILWK